MSDYLTRVDLIKHLNEALKLNLSIYSFTIDFKALASRYTRLLGENGLPFEYNFTATNFSVTVSIEVGDVLPRQRGGCKISTSLAQKIIAACGKNVKAAPPMDPQTAADIATQKALIAALGERGYQAYMDDLDGLGAAKKDPRKPGKHER